MELAIQRSEQSLATRRASTDSGQLNSVAKDRWEHDKSYGRKTREELLTIKDSVPVGG